MDNQDFVKENIVKADSASAISLIESGMELTKSELEYALQCGIRPDVREAINNAIRTSNFRDLDVTETKATPPAMASNVHSVNFCDQDGKAAQLINHRYEVLTDTPKAQSRAVIEIGIIMLSLKEQLPHGALTKWREENTNVSKTWDHYCRKAAEKFIEQHGKGTASALIEGTICNENQIEQAEQLLIEFTDGKGPSALLQELGIKNKPQPKIAALPAGETEIHDRAKRLILPVMEQIRNTMIFGETSLVQHLKRGELETLEGDLTDALRKVQDLIKAG